MVGSWRLYNFILTFIRNGHLKDYFLICDRAKVTVTYMKNTFILTLELKGFLKYQRTYRSIQNRAHLLQVSFSRKQVEVHICTHKVFCGVLSRTTLLGRKRRQD